MNVKVAVGLVIGLSFGFAASFVARQPQAAAREKAKTERWEYQVVACGGGELQGQEKAAKHLTSQFNTLAAHDWEYVGPVIANPEAWTMLRQTDAYSLVLFKRAKR
jgi:hypothetical protein